MLPEYLAKAVPNPKGNRAPWYANTAPTYAGIFLWVAFYNQMARRHAGPRRSRDLCLLALAIAGVLCYLFYYRAPAMLGMQTGYPLYVVGSSTFGTTGGYLMPGILMGLLQIGWFAVATFVATDFILKGVQSQRRPGHHAVHHHRRALGPGVFVRRREGHSVRGEGRHLPEFHSAADAADRAVPDGGQRRAAIRSRPDRRIRTWRSPR